MLEVLDKYILITIFFKEDFSSIFSNDEYQEYQEYDLLQNVVCDVNGVNILTSTMYNLTLEG